MASLYGMSRSSWCMLYVATCLLLTICAFAVASPPCPTGLKCARGRALPQAQAVKYAGFVGACYAAGSANLPPAVLDNAAGTYLLLGNINEGFNGKKETPFLLRAEYLKAITQYNVLTAFRTKAAPFAFEPGFGLPFTSRNPSASVKDISTAFAYAILRVAPVFSPEAIDALAQGVRSLGLDPTYTGRSNFSDPRDIGNAAGLATAAFAAKDGFNSNGQFGTPATGWQFYDYTGWLPTNPGDSLKDITKWQPLLEENDLGYFQYQTHVASSLQYKQNLKPFSEPASSFFSRYKLPSNPYKPQDQLSKSDLKKYKEEADKVIQATATLTDFQKLVMENFDAKVSGFGAVPGITLTSFKPFGDNTMFDLSDFNMRLAAMYDATLLTWNLKLKVNAVRPVSAIRYLYDKTNITAYAGAYQGTKSFQGRLFNSYLRTMPHAEYPSGTACVCVAFAEWWLEYLKKKGYSKTFYYTASFPQGCSLKEPGAAPATNLTVTYTSIDKFISDCSGSRVWAGVHFQRTVDDTNKLCKGLGIAAWKKFQALLAGKS